MKMMLVLCVTAVLLGFVRGKPLHLQPSDNKTVSCNSSALVIKMNRCQIAPLSDAGQMLMEELNLERVPQVSLSVMKQLREHWKVTFRAPRRSTPAEGPGTSTTSIPQSLGSDDLTNNAEQHCCELASEIFIKDLGWDNWIVYPESFTYIQCRMCTANVESMSPSCPIQDSSLPHAPSQAPSCQPSSQRPLPFLYLDEFDTLVISSVRLVQECRCPSV
ncbi:gonadal somatic cell derived factor [Paramormyrops kingsleyae]|uniref:Inhibin beta E chain-like n=1 Tax=Paramormyrops kingsleyae TaxID=1676925 RepID=A0A3B3QTF9_9TELE|nr:inhibin beta E chain-like [Paramormyrops kingsleyae]XP_023658949.1 inhibin beta E chain-like [Paramormyrops kingsleyae]